MTEQLDLLHRCLVDALRDRRPDGSDRPVTVAEIHEELVPYSAVRETLGVGLNADYEHVLLRLLAGEGGLARIQSPDAREELRRELESMHPDVRVFREYSDCAVRVRGSGAARAGGSADDRTASDHDTSERPAAADPAGERAGDGRDAPEHAEHAAGERPAGRGGSVGGADGTAAGGRTASPAGVCPFCLVDVPDDRSVRYCPHCGESQRLRPCPSCGVALDRDWRFCVTCGATAAPAESSGTA